MVDDLKKLREAKISTMIKKLSPKDSTMDVSAFTEYELNFYRNVLSDPMMRHKTYMTSVDTTGSSL